MSERADETLDIAIQVAGVDAVDASQDEEIPQPTRWVGILEWFDEKVYILVGIAFLLAALLSLVYGLLYLGNSILTTMFVPAGFAPQALFTTKEIGATDIIDLVSDLLLTLIIMEVLGTVVHHLRDGETTLRPFLFIGIISATRGILAVGARLSVSGTLSQQEFIYDMVELGVDAIVIIALGVTMNLIGKYLEEGAIPRRGRNKRASGQGRRGKPDLSPSTATRVLPARSGLGLRSIFVLMALIILVALTLIGLLLSQGHL